MIPQSLKRRIKIHVQAKEHGFFAACAPGLEEVCARELEELGVGQVVPTAGGVEFGGRLPVMYRANLMLRSAGRIWMRVGEFRAGALEELYRRVRALRWETLVWPWTPLHIQVTLRSSRITHAGKTKDTVVEAIRARLEESGFVENFSPEDAGQDLEDHFRQMLLVHLGKNRCRLSLDSSGEHLHRRGYRLETAKAPLRETLAAGVIMASGWEPGQPFLDPMCGAGTFPIEAALMACRIPPGERRQFAFMRWPSYREAQWRYILNQARQACLAAAPAPIEGRDKNAGAVRISRANAQRAGVEGIIRFRRVDFFKDEIPGDLAGPGFLFLNPPYGRRVEGPGQDRAYYSRLGARLKRAYRGWLAAVLVPRGEAVQALGLEPFKVLHLDHGGIKVSVVYARL